MATAATQRKFKVGSPVICDGKFATITGRDTGTGDWIIEYCDWRDGRFVTAREARLSHDTSSECS